MTIVGDSDEERHNERELGAGEYELYGSTPNYAFIWDEAGFEGTAARIREKQKAGDFKGMARRSRTSTSRRLRPGRRGMAWPTRSSKSIGESQRASSFTTRSAIASASSGMALSLDAYRTRDSRDADWLTNYARPGGANNAVGAELGVHTLWWSVPHDSGLTGRDCPGGPAGRVG